MPTGTRIETVCRHMKEVSQCPGTDRDAGKIEKP
jgi:hypothetical protein